MKATTLDGRGAVVTGAAGKLGPVWVGALLEAGAGVLALTFPGTEKDQELQRLRQRFDDRLIVHAGDVTNREDLVAAAKLVESEWREPPHVLVNNAGVDQPPALGEGALLEDIDAEGFRRVLDVNVVGAFQAMQVFGAAMAKAERGSIVNVGSLYASVSPDARLYDHIEMDPPFLKPPAYGASKAGLINLTRYFATHLAPHVRVNALSPGGVRGEQDPQFIAKFSSRVPLARLAEPDELIGPLLFLASDASSYVTGIDLRVDGGFTAW